MRIKLSTTLMILGVVLLPTNLTTDSSINKDISAHQTSLANEAVLGEMDNSNLTPLKIYGQEELQLPNLSLPFNIESNWTSADFNTPGIIWEVGDSAIKFAVKDGKFISTNPQDTWFVYGWFGSIEAITKPYNIEYPQWDNRHNGIDFAGRVDLEITSASDGRVIFTGDKIGKTVEIDAGNNYSITYGHLLDISVKVGDIVQIGDLIGRLGNTGTTNPHLHFQVDKIEDGYKTAINPLTLMNEDWSRVVIPDADANRFYEGSQDPHLQPNFIW